MIAALLIAAVTASAAAAPADAPAKPVQQGVASYPASFFQASRPPTALDMVLLLPGFAFDAGADVRGFADGAGNVLIDGERPTTKQDNLYAILRRIPADQVERIDIIRGGAPGIDMQGRTVMANVVRKQSGGLSGAVAESNTLNLQDGRYVPFLRLEFSKSSGGTTLEGSLNGGEDLDDSEGPGPHEILGPDGQPDSTAEGNAKARGRAGSATLSYEFPWLGGKLKLNGLGWASRYIDHEWDASPAPADVDNYRERDLMDRGELGAHYTRDFGSQTTLETVLIQQLKRHSERSSYVAPGDDELFDETDALAESVGRATLRYRFDPKLSLEWASEVDYNIQDDSSTYLVNAQPSPLPAANVKVEERRTDESAVVTWSPSSRVTLESGLRVEASIISSVGDVDQDKTLVYPKPRAVLTLTPDTADQVRIRFEREVTQLDFGDFVAGGALNAGGLRAGNPALLPQDTWVTELAVERKFWGRGDLILTGRHLEIGNAADRVQLDGYDEAGNVGHARQDDLRVDLALPLDRLFIKNGLIRGNATWSWSTVTDPTTGQTRPLSNVSPFAGEAHFTQDLTHLRSTWGVDVEFRQTQPYWRFDEVDVYNYGTLLTPFFEYKPTTKLSLRFELGNALDRVIQRTLTYYTGPRTPSLAAEDADFRAERPGRTAFFRLRQGF